MKRVKAVSDSPRAAFLAASAATDYDDFVIRVRRKDARTVSVNVDASPAGRMLMTPEDATTIGKRLAQLLFPGKAFHLFAESVAAVLARPNRGLRIRLGMDASLLDLPWEYLYRPDCLGQGISGFLLLDPSISMVRHAADERIRIQPRRSLAARFCGHAVGGEQGRLGRVERV